MDGVTLDGGLRGFKGGWGICMVGLCLQHVLVIDCMGLFVCLLI